jgi:multisubunit Na+/H+ antiporter MnhF subunit
MMLDFCEAVLWKGENIRDGIVKIDCCVTFAIGLMMCKLIVVRNKYES